MSVLVTGATAGSIPRSLDRRRFVKNLSGLAASTLVPASAAADERSGSTESPSVKQIRAGVLDVGYLESGPPNGRPIVLLHGFPYDVRSYDEVARQLAAKGRRVIVPYLRGYGPTRFLDASTPRVGQQAALARDLLALLDALHIERAMIAGFDWGGRAACCVAALHPERVSSLISSGGPGYNIQNQNLFLTPRDAAFERRHWFYYYLNAKRGMTAFSEGPATYSRYLWQDFSPTWHFTDATFEATAVAFKNPDYVPVAIHSYRFRIGEVPGEPSLEPIERQLSTSPKITVPTIVIQGAAEGVDPPEPLEVMAPHFTQLVQASAPKGVGHNAPQEAPDLFAAAILELDR